MSCRSHNASIYSSNSRILLFLHRLRSWLSSKRKKDWSTLWSNWETFPTIPLSASYQCALNGTRRNAWLLSKVSGMSGSSKDSLPMSSFSTKRYRTSTTMKSLTLPVRRWLVPQTLAQQVWDQAALEAVAKATPRVSKSYLSVTSTRGTPLISKCTRQEGDSPYSSSLTYLTSSSPKLSQLIKALAIVAACCKPLCNRRRAKPQDIMILFLWVVISLQAQAKEVLPRQWLPWERTSIISSCLED
jgi:hypothetical protein